MPRGVLWFALNKHKGALSRHITVLCCKKIATLDYNERLRDSFIKHYVTNVANGNGGLLLYKLQMPADICLQTDQNSSPVSYRP